MITISCLTNFPGLSSGIGIFNVFPIECQPAVEILPPKIETYVGAPNKGLKIISMQLEGSTLRLDVEGLSGKKYELDIVNPEKVEKVVGAAQIGNTLKIPIPDDNPGKFVRHEIVITEK